jgi:hypothetical protein
VIPTAPLALRNRLAETVLEAVHDAAARERLRALAAGDLARLGEPWTSAEAGAGGERVRARAAAALRALDGVPVAAAPPASRAEALAVAARLFDAGLHFEVHEVLEPWWARASGEEREALQGLVQIAVGYQHLANGNLAGARALLAEGAARAHGRTLDGRALEPLARAASADAARLPAPPPAAPAFPRG